MLCCSTLANCSWNHCRSIFTSSPLRYVQRELWRLDRGSPFLEIPEAWITSLDTKEPHNLSLTQLHPEMPGGGAKPWPQKRQGRHHAGSIRSPGFIRGGFAHGVRGPKVKFYMLPETIRISGLCTALTIKHCQDDLVIVDDFASLPDSDPQFLQDIAEERNWGYSVLFVDISADKMPSNIVDATEEIPYFNLFPLYGLNCYSIMKYDTIVFSMAALIALERRILEQLHKIGPRNKQYRYMDMKQKILAEGEHEEHPIYTPFV